MRTWLGTVSDAEEYIQIVVTSQGIVMKRLKLVVIEIVPGFSGSLIIMYFFRWSLLRTSVVVQGLFGRYNKKHRCVCISFLNLTVYSVDVDIFRDRAV